MTVVYSAFASHFFSFNSCVRKWQYLHAKQNHDWKRNAGAGRLINRVPVSGVSANKMPIKYFKTNVDIPHIRLRNTQLFFLPERLFIRRGNRFAAVFYRNLQIEGGTTRFIEDEIVPGDATVVDHTWKYVNRTADRTGALTKIGRVRSVCILNIRLEPGRVSMRLSVLQRSGPLTALGTISCRSVFSSPK